MSTSNGRVWALAGALAVSLLAAHGAAAQSRWSLGADIGTMGVGAEVGFMASPHFTLRGDFDYFRYDGEVNGSVVTYKGHFHVATGGLFGDWHPWANGWLVTAGAFIGARDAGGGPQLQAINTIGGQTFTLDEARGINAKIKLDEFAPTLALGYNNTFQHKHWGFKALAGVVFSEKPTVELSRLNGTPLDTATFQRLQAALIAEQDKIADRLHILQTYPLIQVGVAYRF
jgi:hypothetical protein